MITARRHVIRSACRGVGLLLIVAFAGCRSTSRVPATAVPVALPATLGAGAAGATGVAVGAPSDRWWEAFADAELNGLITRALADNLDLRTAWERLRQAEAAARIQGAGSKPTVSLGGSATGTRTDSGLTMPRSERVNTTATLGLNLSASYEVDLWGGVAARIASADLATQASAADLRTAGITVAGEVADTWYRLLTARARLATLQRLRATNATQLTVLEKRYDLGRAEGADVLQQRRLLAGTDATLASAAGEVSSAEIHLVALLGLADRAGALPATATLPSWPGAPVAALPGDVLLRRPDVQAAWLRLQAADEGYAAATADRLPTLRLTGSASTSASQVRELFRANLLSLAAELAIPLLDGGRLKATADQQRAAADVAYWSLAQTIVAAAEEAESALAAERHQADYLEQLRQQLTYARQAADAQSMRYYQGTDNFTSYLQAVVTAQDLESAVLSAEGTLLRQRVAVYRAVAGDLPLAATPRPADRVVPPWPLGRATPSASSESPAPVVSLETVP